MHLSAACLPEISDYREATLVSIDATAKTISLMHSAWTMEQMQAAEWTVQEAARTWGKKKRGLTRFQLEEADSMDSVVEVPWSDVVEARLMSESE